jgi:hypothetical protein
MWKGKEWDAERKRMGRGKEKNRMQKGKECDVGGAWLIERKGGRMRRGRKP